MPPGPVATSADRLRQVTLVVVGAAAMAVAAWGAGAFGGQEIQNAASGALAADATVLAPGTGAFRVWSVIYLALIVTVILQALPSRAALPLHRTLGWWVLASLVLNAAWISAAQLGLLGLTVPIIGALVAVLARCLVLLRARPAAPRLDSLIVGTTVGLYLGWVCVATVANVTAVLAFSSWDLSFLPEGVWVTVVLAVAAAVCGVTALAAGQRAVAIGVTLTSTWGLVWIAIGRLTAGPDSTITVVVALAAAAVVLLLGALGAVRAPRPATAPSPRA
ncbi:TspO/MBR related protein [Serinibacter salmoneus]|uniref:TspO/MBR related protein n=2 Tax=Serinibacter salmoneus TaxID=556530 RepID=A0A2A9D3X1_9MICO|nr:TspO/MBR related protein [Serinibacter salmoneus]